MSFRFKVGKEKSSTKYILYLMKTLITIVWRSAIKYSKCNVFLFVVSPYRKRQKDNKRD